ncbi:MAG TPA: ATP-binding protein [Chthoniobacteraceae bacterium]|jgi:PAS domain S-box-containing protein|nr:ATP-binding protein [Chthoniobacteraceae bacterium]
MTAANPTQQTRGKMRGVQLLDPLFPSTGPMADRVRAFDWAATPLGPLHTWPQSLIVAAGLCLNCRFPAFIWWGPELINIHNDAYAPVLGSKHPEALGRPARALWAEIWPIIGEDVEAVVQRGKTICRERVRLILLRNGYPEETWFTYSHSPIPDGAGGIGGLFQVCSDETAQVLAEAERARLAEQRQLALNAARMGWWHYDPRTRIARWDERFKEMFGVAGTQRANEEILARIDAEDLPRVWAAVEMALDPVNPQPYASHYRIHRDDGSTRWIEAHGVATFEGEGSARQAVSFVGTVRDITERRGAEEALRASMEEANRNRETAEAASRAKDNFLAALSHELRTPLTPVLMTASLLREDPALSPELRAQLAMIERNVALEARLIDDLLDLTRITRGKLALRAEPCDVHALIGLVVEVLGEEAREKQLALELELDAGRPGLTGDPARLQQIFWNLLRNAVKFTPAGGRIWIRSRNAGDAEPTICIDVSDTGIGFEPSAKQRIFQPFEQAAPGPEHRFGGLGLGLAIAQAIVDLHHGTITAESPGPGQGATFSVCFPGAAALPAAAPASAGPAAVRPDEFALDRPLRLLLVEDHLPTLEVLTRLLTRAGHHIVGASTLADARAAVERERFDAILSDLGLPDGTGLDLMRELRAQYGLRGVALSGYGMEEDLARSREAGFIAHLIKPVDVSELRRALRLLAGGAG